MYDNIYFTLRDIFVNASSYEDVMSANLYNRELTGGIYYEDRTENFKYNNLLDEKRFIQNLIKWLNKLKNDIWYDEPSEKNDIDINELNEKYIKFDNWCTQFNELIHLLENYDIKNDLK